jgi:hypothetical protein
MRQFILATMEIAFAALLSTVMGSPIFRKAGRMS